MRQVGIIVARIGRGVRLFANASYVSYVCGMTRFFKLRMNWRKCARHDFLNAIRAELPNQIGAHSRRPQTVDRFVEIKIAARDQMRPRLTPCDKHCNRVGEFGWFGI